MNKDEVVGREYINISRRIGLICYKGDGLTGCILREKDAEL